jgi:hypothetical protein
VLNLRDSTSAEVEKAIETETPITAVAFSTHWWACCIWRERRKHQRLGRSIQIGGPTW